LKSGPRLLLLLLLMLMLLVLLLLLLLLLRHLRRYGRHNAVALELRAPTGF
jgi:hypothetical protein